ncbi:hypothetical protein SeMB42_g07337 [Synchytrium endobioticum]|uniref:Uncharacterized protein n=1 Tax=Synchytrium endobioticum TaxID=286115 RepID=A0A507C4K1_9FUNG|nr:hypothetical protein SeMB42_g07337 [Synchytrium endobioticum]
MSLPPRTAYNPPRTAAQLHSSMGMPSTTNALGNQLPATAPLSLHQIPEGKYTWIIYAYIQQGRFNDVVKLLANEVSATAPSGANSRSRAALSLLAYCHYQLQEFVDAAECYEQLARLFPEVEEYKLYYAQCLYKAGNHVAATKVCLTVDAPNLSEKSRKLQAALKYEANDLEGCKTILDDCSQDDVDTMINTACLVYKEGKVTEALQRYQAALKITGYQADLTYYVALCYYCLRQYDQALKCIGDLIERGVKEHPELNVGTDREAVELRYVGNSQTLHETCLVEAFNLKAAILYVSRDYEGSREALQDMPPRQEHDLDAITLHNLALTHMEADPTGGFEKMTFLINNAMACPPEAFENLLLLYCKYEYYDLAADLLAQQAGVGVVDPYVQEFLEAASLRRSAPDEAYRRFADMGNKHRETLDLIAKKIQEYQKAQKNDEVKHLLREVEEGVNRYIPAMMHQARILWDKQDYASLENLLRSAAGYCAESPVWMLNVAHVLFIQESKYTEAILYYRLIVKDNIEQILNIQAIVLANLCVSYIMTSQNEEAEELMRRIEKEEERVGYEDPSKRCYHLCIVNLVIGTLYCAKGNYEFGISRVCKSLEPFNRKLGTDTWHYAKRPFCALLETLSRHMLLLRDSSYQEILTFLEGCEIHGKDIPAAIDPANVQQLDPLKSTVAYEASRTTN